VNTPKDQKISVITPLKQQATMADNDPWLNGNKTWQKWKGLEEGGELKYDRKIWGKMKDEERLIRSLQVE
jgi:hypothetical protein